ncbi:MAG: APC family permease [Candidatus Micrarchaeia archaeon]
MKLKRELGLISLVLYGIGVIVGAGIYSLIGIGAGLAGDMLWLAFLIAGAIAFFTAMSYAELSPIIPYEAAEYRIVERASGSRTLSFIIGWTTAIAHILFASTVALAFAGYLSAMSGIPPTSLAVAVVLCMGGMNFLGLRLSSLYNDICAVVSVLGLVIIAVLALASPGGSKADLLLPPQGGLSSIVAAVAIIFFAFIGFENVANITEEAKDSRRSVPLAMILSLVVSTALYCIVSVAALSLSGWRELAGSSAPLSLVATRSVIDLSPLLSVIALLATSNTVLIALISSSRMLFGISRSGALPRIFSSLGGKGTPWFSAAITTLLAVLAVMFLDIRTSAELTNSGIFISYLAVNLSLVILRPKKAGIAGPRVLGFPVLAFLGALSSLAMLVYIGIELWPYQLIIIACGVVVLFLHRERDSEEKNRIRR